MTRKKKVIKPSFAHCRRSSVIPSLPSRIESFAVQTDSYDPGNAFAQTSAAAAEHSNTAAPPASVLRKLRTGAPRFRAHAVRPVGGLSRVVTDPSDPLPTGSAPGCALILHSAYAQVRVRPFIAPSMSQYDGRMSDESIAANIDSLVSEEQELRRREQADSQNPERLEEDRQRLRALEVELDRCWDLLRQRRAREEFGENPDEATVRDADTVERYLQ
jgi:hypothetical protein